MNKKYLLVVAIVALVIGALFLWSSSKNFQYNSGSFFGGGEESNDEVDVVESACEQLVADMNEVEAEVFFEGLLLAVQDDEELEGGVDIERLCLDKLEENAGFGSEAQDNEIDDLDGLDGADGVSDTDDSEAL